MRRHCILIVCLVFLASMLGFIPAATAPASEDSSIKIAQQDYPEGGKDPIVQDKPYTKAAPGPWSPAVAKTHSPMISYQKAGAGLTVTVKIDNHPMDPKKPHYIMWIRLEDGAGKVLGEKNFKPTDPAPIAVFELPSVPAKLKGFEQCNIHGIWMSQMDVKLK